MILKFATKRDVNGNRYFLAFDTDKKIFAETSAHWYCKEDIIEITKKDRRELKERLIKENYNEVNNM